MQEVLLMATLEKLSAPQLIKIIDDTQAELKRRKNIAAATAEIRSILNKYRINFQDIDTQALANTRGRKRKIKSPVAMKSRDERNTVKPKYKDPDSVASWSGRGRAPKWVQNICQKDGIDIETFKKESRFKC